MIALDESTQRVMERFYYQPVLPAYPQPGLCEDVYKGLLQRPRSLPPKYFYDTRGSALFDRICDTPEYYVTRTEDALLARHARRIVSQVRPAHILELGSGTSRKTRHLFDACGSERCYSAYAPFDVCHDILMETGRSLVADYDWLTVTALVGDYAAGLDNLPGMGGTRLFIFLGGTIGNFSHTDGVAFLCELHRRMGPADRLLIGADRVKDPVVLHAAYNDTAGITAEFNLNVLRVLNRELDADFDCNGFYHHACYNPADQQMEMFLIARRDQRISVSALDAVLEIVEGEAIQTEISRKFSPRGLDNLLEEAGFVSEEHFEPENGYFSLILARPYLA